ncbi:MAG: oligosaccharide flippase family protein [bacterium]
MEKDEHYSAIKRSGIISALSLFFQSGYSAMLGLVANLVVTILLSPAIFGMYITVMSLISVLNYFSDIGLAASLVQKKEASRDDFVTTFTVQQFLVVVIISIGFLGSEFVRSFYKLPPEGIYLYWALLVSFFTSSLKTIPSILLERKIAFQKIVLVQITESTVFYITIISLAILKFGLTSFTIAVLLRSIVGLVLVYIISPWKPTFGISKKSLHELLSFGVPFQASSFLALFKDDLITLFLGKVIGFEGVGYIGWAKKWAEAPIRIIMDNITKVLFPVLSRLQHDKEKIKQLIEKIMFYQTALLTPTILGLGILMDDVVHIIPKYSKWGPALPLLYIFCVSAFFASFSSPLINLINSLGKAKIPFVFMLIWTITTWILTPLLTHFYGYYGFPITVMIISLTSIFVVKKAQEFVPFRIFASIYKPFFSSLVMGFVMMFVKQIFPHTLYGMALTGISGALTYLIVLLFIFKINIMREAIQLFKK